MDPILVEYLSFAPIHFIDDNLNAVNTNLYKATAQFEARLEKEFASTGGQGHREEIEKGVVAVETLLERSIDSKFDRWELYVLKNVLCLPAGVQAKQLPHYKALKMDVTSEEEASLDHNLDLLRAQRVAERWKKAKLVKQIEKMSKRKDELQKLETNLLAMKKLAEESEIYPISESKEKLDLLLQDVNQVVSEVESRTSSTNWTTVPLIGTSKNSFTTAVNDQVLYHLGKVNDSKEGDKSVLAWDVTKEYRDALAVGSAKTIESIRLNVL